MKRRGKYLAVDMGGTNVKVAAVSGGEVIEALRLAAGADRGPEHVQRQIEDGIETLFERHGRDSFLAAGVGAAALAMESEVD